MATLKKPDDNLAYSDNNGRRERRLSRELDVHQSNRHRDNDSDQRSRGQQQQHDREQGATPRVARLSPTPRSAADEHGIDASGARTPAALRRGVMKDQEQARAEDRESFVKIGSRRETWVVDGNATGADKHGRHGRHGRA